MARLFFFSGSTSDDFDQAGKRDDLLPPCPDSPNCIRIIKSYDDDPDTVFKTAESVIRDMGAVELQKLDKPLRLITEFRVLIFKDDFMVLIEEAEGATCSVHIRSASRVGYSDLGVNRRRVKRFLSKLEKKLK